MCPKTQVTTHSSQTEVCWGQPGQRQCVIETRADWRKKGEEARKTLRGEDSLLIVKVERIMNDVRRF